jgi:hypothetical protein
VTDRDTALREVAALVSAVLRYGPPALEAEIYPVAFLLGTGALAGPETVERLLRRELGLEERKDDCGEACQATGTPSGTACGKPSAGLYRAACAHGHVRERRLCAGHASPEEGLWCRDCFELGGAGWHMCDVTPVLVSEAVARAVTPGQVAG